MHYTGKAESAYEHAVQHLSGISEYLTDTTAKQLDIYFQMQ